MKRFEALEARLLLAGNVTITTDGGHVTILGDAGDNDFQVFTREVDDSLELVVRGLNGTTVGQGTEFQVITSADLLQGISIDLGAGDDRLDVVALTGLDGVRANGITVLGNAGNDLISIADVDLPGGTISVYGGTNNTGDPTNGMTENDGDDLFSFGVREGRFVVGTIFVTDWNGTNGIYVSDITVHTNFSVSLIDYAPGLDNTNVVSVGRSNLQDLSVDIIGNSADTVLIYDTVAWETTFLKTGGNDDDVAVYQSKLNGITIWTDSGADTQNIYESDVGSVSFVDTMSEHIGKIDRYGLYSTATGGISFVSAGPASGDDVFVADDVTITGMLEDLRLQMGDGADVLILSNISSRGAGSDYLIDMGDGDDSVCLNHAEFKGSHVSFFDRRGNDLISIGNGSSLLGMSYRDEDGTNGIYLTDSNIGRDGLSVDAALAAGNMLFIARVSMGSGALTYTGGEGTDTLQFLDGTLFTASVNTSDVRLSTGGGNDSVSFRNAIFNNAGIYAGTPAAIDRAFSVELGDGDDSLKIVNTDFALQGVFRFDGGSGSNTATASGSASTLTPEVVNLGSFTLPYA